MHEYVGIDLSPLLVPDMKFAVRCETAEEARRFIEAVQLEFPYKINSITPSRVRWDDDNEGHDGGRAYYPDLNGIECDPLMVGSVNYAVSHHYEVINFVDLVIKTNIEESDMPLSELFEALK